MKLSNQFKLIDSRFDQNGLARALDTVSGEMFYIDVAFNKVSEGIKGGKHAGKNIYVLEKEEGIGAYFVFDGNSFLRTTEDVGQCFKFRNGMALVRQKENKFDQPTCSYFINEEFSRISEVFLDAGDFNEFGVADVVNLNKESYIINQSFERISPIFDEVFPPDNNGVMIGIKRGKKSTVCEYYQLMGDVFECVSDQYQSAYPFKNGAAVVQDIKTDLYYVVNEDFEKISKFYESWIGIYGNPGVLMAKEKEKPTYISVETMSKINNPKLYWAMSEALEKRFDTLLTSLEGIVKESDLDNPEFVNDLKVAVKDYLIRNANRLAYDDTSDSYYIRTVPPKKIDKRVNLNKLVSWIDKQVKEAPDRVGEMLEIVRGVTLEPVIGGFEPPKN